MITKECFVNTLKFIKEQRNLEEKFSNLLEKMTGDEFRCDALVYTKYEDVLLNVLNQGMNIDSDDDIIYWWVYDTNFGKEHSEIYEDDKVIAKLDTAGKLYNYITGEN